MNRDRRKRIQTLRDQLSEIAEALDAIANEEQDAFDNMPETFQDGSRGEAMQEAITALEDAKGQVEEAMDTLEGIQ